MMLVAKGIIMVHAKIRVILAALVMVAEPVLDLSKTHF